MSGGVFGRLPGVVVWRVVPVVDLPGDAVGEDRQDVVQGTEAFVVAW